MTALVVASTNGRIGLSDAMAVLRDGGSAVDAVVAGIRPVEANPDDHTVGYSGFPNLLGEVELDASLMDGKTLASGAVGALRDYQDAILLAQYVMNELPHVLLAGDGARQFAKEMGLPPVNLLTPEAKEVWQSRLQPDALSDGDAVGQVRALVGQMVRDPEQAAERHGTVNVIARDLAGNLATGVSTSGWAWKYPGRLGDSPIVGAGNYADNRWGAAACTGRGEMAQRCCTAYSVVSSLRHGLSLTDALHSAMLDLLALDDLYRSEINIVAIDREGNHAAASSQRGKTYVYMTDAMAEPEEAERIVVAAEA